MWSPPPPFPRRCARISLCCRAVSLGHHSLKTWNRCSGRQGLARSAFSLKMRVKETVARIPGHFSLHVLHVKCGGFGGALRLGLLATCPVPIVHGSGLACVPDRPV